MAKITGPLLSEAAHGTIGKTLTFSKRASGNQARFQRMQKDYTNENRTPARAYFKEAMLWWVELSTTEKAEWLTLGRKDC